MVIQYIIVLFIVVWASWMTIRNLVGFFKPEADGSGCAGCSGCALKDVGKDSLLKNRAGN